MAGGGEGVKCSGGAAFVNRRRGEVGGEEVQRWENKGAAAEDAASELWFLVEPVSERSKVSCIIP